MKRVSAVLSLVLFIMTYAAARVPHQKQEPPRPQPKAGQPQKDAADLKDLVGRYELDPTMVENFIIDVIVENGELWAKPSHQSKHRLILKPNGEYTDDQGIGVVFRFNRDAKGNVVSASVTQEGNTVEARKLTLAPPSLVGNVTFKLKGHTEARLVAVAGSFNNWNQSQYFFAREGDGWICRVKVPPGRHTYKFIIDGDWITDPTNPVAEEDERGNVNSVLIVKDEQID